MLDYFQQQCYFIYLQIINSAKNIKCCLKKQSIIFKAFNILPDQFFRMSINRTRFKQSNQSKPQLVQSQISPQNMTQKQQTEYQQINSVKIAVFPKFFKQLNAQQNLKRRRQMRKKQHSIHQHLKQMIFQQIPTEKSQKSVSNNKQKSVSFISDLVNSMNNSENNHKDNNSQIKNNSKVKTSKAKILIKRRYQVIKDGHKIIGEWRNEQLHGDVQIYYKNGYFFQGRYQHGIRIKGHFDFANGYQYTGGFLGDRFRGYGQLKLPNNKIICGDWQQQLLQSKAQIRYPTGQIYYGQIKNYKKHGKGYLFFNDGFKYVGQFHEGHITGNGEYYLNQNLVGRGYWLEGELTCQQYKQKAVVGSQRPKSILKSSSRKNICGNRTGKQNECKQDQKKGRRMRHPTFEDEKITIKSIDSQDQQYMKACSIQICRGLKKQISEQPNE